MFLTSFFLTQSSYKNYSILFSRLSQYFFLDFWNIFCQSLRKVDLTMFSTLEKIKELAKKRGISLAKLEESLGYSTNYFYTLKTKAPNAERLAEIANYFNVSTDYLLGRTDNPKLYTTPDGKEVDLSDLRNSVVLFDGKPLSDDDVYKIEQIIKLSIGVTASENR